MEDFQALGLDRETMQKIEQIQHQFHNNDLNIGLFGAFSVGKSTLVNKLLNKNDLLPSHTNETTAVPTIIQYGLENKIALNKVDGNHQIINHEQFLLLTAGQDVEHIETVEVMVNDPEWFRNIKLIDTPGRNTKYSRHIDASDQAINFSDAAFYVLSWQGLTLEDVVYVKHILRYQPNIYFIVNKVDSINETEGITIDQLRQYISSDIKKALGKDYPVLMVSAISGYQINDMIHLIKQLKQNTSSIKEDKLKHALRHILEQERDDLLNKVAVYNASLIDDYDFEAQKNQLKIGYEKSKEEISLYLDQLRKKIEKSENKISRLLNEYCSELEYSLMSILQKGSSEENLQLLIENEVISTRNKISSIVLTELQSIYGKDNNIELSSFENTNISIKLSELDFDDLEKIYLAKEKKLFDEIEKVNQKLEALESEDTSYIDAERTALETKLAVLAEQATEEYVPQYVQDKNFDPKRFEKMFRNIGMVGDIALATVASLGTATAAKASLQAGKIGTKQAGKAIVKTTIKTTAKNTTKKEIAAQIGKELVKQSIKKVGEKTGVPIDGTNSTPNDTKGNKNGTLGTALKVLDTVTSPVENIAASFGKMLDSDQQPVEREDQNYRNQFFMAKFEIESKLAEDKQRIKELELKVSNNEKLKIELAKKREKLQIKAETEIEKLRTDMENQKNKQLQQHRNEEIQKQVNEVVKQEEENIKLWFKFEIEKAYHIVEQTIPSYINDEVTKWQNEIERIESAKTDDHNKLRVMISECETKIEFLDNLIESYK